MLLNVPVTSPPTAIPPLSDKKIGSVSAVTKFPSLRDVLYCAIVPVIPTIEVWSPEFVPVVFPITTFSASVT